MKATFFSILAVALLTGDIAATQVSGNPTVIARRSYNPYSSGSVPYGSSAGAGYGKGGAYGSKTGTPPYGSKKPTPSSGKGNIGGKAPTKVKDNKGYGSKGKDGEYGQAGEYGQGGDYGSKSNEDDNTKEADYDQEEKDTYGNAGEDGKKVDSATGSGSKNPGNPLAEQCTAPVDEDNNGATNSGTASGSGSTNGGASTSGGGDYNKPEGAGSSGGNGAKKPATPEIPDSTSSYKPSGSTSYTPPRKSGTPSSGYGSGRKPYGAGRGTYGSGPKKTSYGSGGGYGGNGRGGSRGKPNRGRYGSGGSYGKPSQGRYGNGRSQSGYGQQQKGDY